MITGRFAAVLFLAFLLVWMPALKIVFYNPKDSLGIADLAIISLGIAACIAIIALLVLWHRTFGLLVIYLLLGLLAAATINTFLVPSDAAVLDGATLAAGISTPKVAITLAVVAGSIAAWFLRDRSAKIVMTTFVAVLAYAVIFSGTALWKTPIACGVGRSRYRGTRFPRVVFRCQPTHYCRAPGDSPPPLREGADRPLFSPPD